MVSGNISLSIYDNDAHDEKSETRNVWPSNAERGFILHALDSAAIVAITDVQGTIRFVNRKFCEISGYSFDELLGANHRVLNSGAHNTDFFRQMYRTIARGGIWTGEICNRRKDGSLYWVSTTIVPRRSKAGKITNYVSIRFDITDRKNVEAQLLESQKELERSVNVDYLTGLASRRRLNDFLTARIENGMMTGQPLCLALMDLDHFKHINDSFGHDVGDAVLKVVAERLFSVAPNKGFVARLGGDEFAIVLRGRDIPAQIAAFENILEALRQPITMHDYTHRCTASMGVALFDPAVDTLDSLIKNADIALYKAKAYGRDRLKVFDASMREKIESRLALHLAVETGLDQEQFAVYYQPVVPARQNSFVSFEALLRWRHPERGLISPFEFQDAFKSSGIAWTFGDFVMRRVAGDVRVLLERRIPIDRFAINVSDADFRDGRYPERLLSVLAEYGVPTCHICIEVTEGMFLGSGADHVKRGLSTLHDAGIEIALDDFGTGFASLTHLRSLSFDRLKIDRSFVKSINESPEEQKIVEGIIGIAHAIGKTVTAEGVETREQCRLLNEMGCDHLQGWLFAKAQPIERLPYFARTLGPNMIRDEAAELRYRFVL